MSQDTPRQDRLLKRLRALWTWELFDSFFLPAIVVLSARILRVPLGLFAIYSAALVTWLPWQGATYWWLKLQAVRKGSPIARKQLGWFALLKRTDWALLALPPALLGAKAVAGTAFDSRLDVVAGLYTLAFPEQINYYHVQLRCDYPPDWRCLIENRKLRQSSLNRALRTLNRPSGAQS
jgi:hypothetical protein